MAFNGSGVFNRVHDWAADAAAALKISSTRMDSEDDGFATGLTNCVCKDGQSTTTAQIPFAQGISVSSTWTATGATCSDLGTVTTADINGGTIDGVTIGGASAAACTVTTFTSTGIDDNASSTAITIDSSGNVGIGTSSIDVTTYFQNVLHLSDTSNIGIMFEKGSPAKKFSIGVNTAQALVFADGATARMTLDSSGELFISGSSATTASAANAYIDTGTSPANQIKRSTSSLRYKKDVEDLDVAYSSKIKQMRPVWFRSNANGDRQDWSHYGLIAEELAEIEPRLVHWWYAPDQYEEYKAEDGETRQRLKDGAELTPDGVQYDRLTVLLLKELQILQDKISALEAANV